MFQSIAAAVDWAAVYLTLAQVAIMFAGLWVVLRGTRAILRFVLSSGDRGSGWGADDSYWDGYTAEDDAADRAAAGLGPNVEFLQAQAAGSTGTAFDPLDPDSPEYIPEYEDGPSGEAWEYMQANAEADGTAGAVDVDYSSPDWVPPPLTDEEEEANQREADRMIGWREKEDW